MPNPCKATASCPALALDGKDHCAVHRPGAVFTVKGADGSCFCNLCKKRLKVGAKYLVACDGTAAHAKCLEDLAAQ